MAGLVPFNRKNKNLTPTGFEDFYMIDDFFNDNWMQGRNLLRDTFKIDVRETDQEYVVEAELPGIKREEINLSIEDENLCISVNRNEEVKSDDNNYVHRERRVTSMSRRIHLINSNMEEIKAKLEDGVLVVTVPKQEKTNNSRIIDID